MKGTTNISTTSGGGSWTSLGTKTLGTEVSITDYDASEFLAIIGTHELYIPSNITGEYRTGWMFTTSNYQAVSLTYTGTTIKLNSWYVNGSPQTTANYSLYYR